MEGTVICASRAEGFVARAGSAATAAGVGRGGMARAGAATGAVTGAALGALALDGLASVAGFTDLEGALTTGLAFGAGAVLLFAGLAAAFSGAALLTDDFFAGTLATAFFATAFGAGLAVTFFAGTFAAVFAGAFFAGVLADLTAGFAGLTGVLALAAGLAAFAVAFG